MSEVKNIVKRFLSLTLIFALVAAMLPAVSMPVNAATSGTVTGLTDSNIGLSFSGDAEDAWTASGTKITGSAKSTAGTCNNTNYNSTLTIKNNKSTKATLSFDYEIGQNSGTIKVDGNKVTSGDKFSKGLTAGESIEVYIESGSTSAATKITMTNVTLVSDVTATATFMPAENGSYTVDDKAITGEYSNTQSSLTAYQVVAAPADGYKFFGWYDVINEKYISTNASTSLNIERNCTITAKFASKTAAIFETGGQPFDDLNEAVWYAQLNNQDKITLTSDGTISGDYTIPSGITLLIPFDDAGTLYTDTPETMTTTPESKPFRTLTMAEGSTITVKGAISIGGRYYAAGGGQQGRCVGGYGYIKMAEKSSITVKNSGNLYAWGFISGSGSVTAESGATVYEFYQIADFRGGSATIAMKNKVFPFSQYFVQNIEVPLTIYSGAKEKVYSGMFMSKKTFATTINFIGDGGMFNTTLGSITKDYDEKTDRLVFSVDGEAELSTLSLELAGMGVNSADYVLPITNNITFNIERGSITIYQDAALLAGTEVNIAEGAEVNVANGKNLYVYDADEWNSDNFVWGPCKFKSVAYAPGKAYNRSNSDLVDAKIDVNGTLTATGCIYTTAGGADICSSNGTGSYVQNGAVGTETETYQYNANGNSAKKINITPAKLKNEDGKYVNTSAESTSGDIFEYVKSEWHNFKQVVVADDYLKSAADCTHAAVYYKSCACGEASDTLTFISGAALGHTGGKATCTAKAKCERCGKEYGDLGDHEYGKLIAEVPATHLTKGTKAHYICSVCNKHFDTDKKEVELKDLVIAKLTAHTYDQVVVADDYLKSAADCTHAAVYYKSCACGEASDTLTFISGAALGHTGGKATCTAKAKCERCGKEYGDLGDHEYGKLIAEVPATHLTKGTKAHYICSVCNKHFDTDKKEVELKDLVIAKLTAHTYDQVVVADDYLKSAADCTHAAVYYKSCACGEASDTLTFISGAALGHTGGKATCTAKAKCERCGKEYGDLGDHEYGKLIAEVPATHLTKGTKAHYICSVCNKHFDTDKKEVELKDLVIAKLTAHTYDQVVVADDYLKSAADCTHAAVYYKSCACGEASDTLTFISGAALGHTGGKASCTAKAKCERCGKEYGDLGDHEYGKLIAEVPATHLTKGTKAHYICSVCNKHFDTDKKEVELKDLVIAKLTAHTYDQVVVADDYLKSAADCTHAAVYYKSCACGEASDTLTFISGAALGHTGGKATCTAKAKCERCGKEYGDLGDHEYGKLIAEVPATHLTKGTKAHYICSVCNKHFDTDKKEVELKDLVIAKLTAHTYDQVVVADDYLKSAADCTHAAVYYKSCACGEASDTLTFISGAALGHTGVIDAAKEPTCTETGLTEGKHCSVCNEVLEAQKEIPATGHDWKTEWTVDKEATCKDEGSKSHHCKNCDAMTDVTVIAMVDHNYQNGKCTYCGEVKHTSSSGTSRDYVTNVNTDDAKTTVANIIPRNNGKLNISDTILKEIFSKVAANSSTKVVIRVHHKYTNSSSVYQINLSQDMIDNLIKDNKYELVINTGQGEFTLNVEILKAMSAKAADGISVTSRDLDKSEMTKKQKAVCGEYGSIIQLIATDSKGEIIWSGNGAHTALIPVPNKLADKDVKILVIDKYGLYRELESSVVEQNGKKYFSFSSDGTARYIITDSDNAVSLLDKQAQRLKKLEKGVKKTKLKLNVSVTSKGNMKLTWKKSKGYSIDYYQVYRAVKKKGFGKKAFYQNSSDIRKYINTKNLKQGKRYYYKVRGVRLVGDKLVYTGWSNIDSEIAD